MRPSRAPSSTNDGEDRDRLGVVELAGPGPGGRGPPSAATWTSSRSCSCGVRRMRAFLVASDRRARSANVARSASAVSPSCTMRAAVHHRVPVGEAQGELHVLLDEQDRHARRPVQLGDGVLDLDDDRRLDALGRLVEHQQLRAGSPAPGRSPAAGPGRRDSSPAGRPSSVRERREDVERVVDGGAVAARGRARARRCRFSAHGQLREHLVALGHVADPGAGPLVRRAAW